MNVFPVSVYRLASRGMVLRMCSHECCCLDNANFVDMAAGYPLTSCYYRFLVPMRTEDVVLAEIELMPTRG